MLRFMLCPDLMAKRVARQGSASSNGFKLSNAGRRLPSSLESNVLSFAAGDDLASLLATSNEMAAAVQNYLRRAKHLTLRLREPYKLRHNPEEKQILARQAHLFSTFASLGATGLQRLVLFPSQFLEHERGHVWLLDVVTRNCSTLKSVELSGYWMHRSPWTLPLLAAFARCPELDTFELPHPPVHDSSAALRAILSSCRKIETLRTHRPDDVADAFLAGGLPLTHLQVQGHTQAGLAHLGDTNHARLSSLHIWFGETSFLRSAQILQQQLPKLPKLEDLLVGVCNQEVRNTEAAVCECVWDLPAVKKLNLLMYHCPQIVAPQLEELDSSFVGVRSLRQMLKRVPKLRALTVLLEDKDDNRKNYMEDEDYEQFRFDEVKAGKDLLNMMSECDWPLLERFADRSNECEVPLPPALCAIASRFPQMRHLDVYLSDDTQPFAAQVLLASLPLLETCQLRASIFRSRSKDERALPDAPFLALNRLRSLQLEIADDALFASFRFPALTECRLEGAGVKCFQFDRALANMPTLTSLKCDHEAIVQFARACTSPMLHLKEVRLYLNRDVERSWVASAMRYLLLASPALEDVFVSATCTFPRSDLDLLLNRPALREFCTMFLRADAPITAEFVARMITSCPRLNRLGVGPVEDGVAKQLSERFANNSSSNRSEWFALLEPWPRPVFRLGTEVFDDDDDD